jgi:UDPglucose--hexose-1-phosphate uridylyltransferase
MNDNNIREIRINPIDPSKSVLIATERGRRPRKRKKTTSRDKRQHVDTCPFCRGNEHMTPAAVFQEPASGEWQIRIVENLYPILDDDLSIPMLTSGVQRAIEGYGHHEVIIDHADHGIVLHRMPEAHLALLLEIYRNRMQLFYDTDPRIKYVLVFKNFGAAAGGSMPHTHSQTIAMPIVPHDVHDEVTYSHDYFHKNGRCIFCALIDGALSFGAVIYKRRSGKALRKLEVGQYVIEKGNHFIAIKPFASRYEWEVHILPLKHQSDFLNAAREELADMARVLKRTMARLAAVVGEVEYNYFLHSIPHGNRSRDETDSYHWHLEICPRTSIPSGFELGSGLFVNSISPEEAARKLREADID